VEDVAHGLGMSERTLLRRLSGEGLSFTEILQQLRRDLAVRYLTDRKLHVSKIAWLLGFQEVSAFTHAFKRWTGKTPSKMRTAGTYLCRLCAATPSLIADELVLERDAPTRSKVGGLLAEVGNRAP
jgi:AraC-like DNA-binding protein